MGTMAEEDILSRDNTTSRNRLGLSAGPAKSRHHDDESIMVNSSYKKLLSALADENLDDNDSSSDEIPSLHDEDMALLEQTGDWSEIDDPFAELDGDELECAVAALTTALDFDPVTAAQDPALRPVEDDISDAILRSRAVSDDALAEDSLGKRDKPDALSQVAAMLHSGDVSIRRATIGERPLVAAPAAEQSIDLAKLYQTAARFTPTMSLQTRPSAQAVPKALLRETVEEPEAEAVVDHYKEPVEAVEELTVEEAVPAAEEVAEEPPAPPALIIEPEVEEVAEAIPVVIAPDPEPAEEIAVEAEPEAQTPAQDAEPETEATPPSLIADQDDDDSDHQAPEETATYDPHRPLMIAPAEPVDEPVIDILRDDYDPLVHGADSVSALMNTEAPAPVALPAVEETIDDEPPAVEVIHLDSIDGRAPEVDDTPAETPAPRKTRSLRRAKEPRQTPRERRLKARKPAIQHEPAPQANVKKRRPALTALTAMTLLLTVGGVGMVAFHDHPMMQNILGTNTKVVAPTAPSLDTPIAPPTPVEPTNLAVATEPADATTSTEAEAEAPITATAPVEETVTAVEPTIAAEAPAVVSDAPAVADVVETETTVAALTPPPAVDVEPATAEPLRLAAPAPLPLPAELTALEKSAIEGNRQAQHDLGAHFAAGRLVDQDFERAAYWFQEAAIRGVANAQYNMGVLLQQGLGVPADAVSALAWYRRAAENGHVEAQYNMGVAYADGIGIDRDVPKAVRWFEQAAAAGIARAAFNLGVMYEVGMLGRPDLDAARQWYRQAATSGDRDADDALARLNGNQ